MLYTKTLTTDEQGNNLEQRCYPIDALSKLDITICSLSTIVIIFGETDSITLTQQESEISKYSVSQVDNQINVSLATYDNLIHGKLQVTITLSEKSSIRHLRTGACSVLIVTQENARAFNKEVNLLLGSSSESKIYFNRIKQLNLTMSISAKLEMEAIHIDKLATDLMTSSTLEAKILSIASIQHINLGPSAILSINIYQGTITIREIYQNIASKLLINAYAISLINLIVQSDRSVLNIASEKAGGRVEILSIHNLTRTRLSGLSVNNRCLSRNTHLID
jgi:hypothetical protein